MVKRVRHPRREELYEQISSKYSLVTISSITDVDDGFVVVFKCVDGETVQTRMMFIYEGIAPGNKGVALWMQADVLAQMSSRRVRKCSART